MSTARDQLARLLTLLPLAGRPEGVGLEEAAQTLGVEIDQVLADVQVLTDRAFYLPPGSAEDLQMVIEGSRIRVFGPNAFRRPLRLTRGELLALSIALRVAGVATAEAEAILAEIEAELAAQGSDPSGQPHTPLPRHPAARQDGDRIRQAFSQGVLERRVVTFAYLKPGADSAEVRVVEPYRLLHGEGEWYLVGRDPSRDELRLFRIDRVLGAHLQDRTFAPDPDFDITRVIREGRVALVTADADPATVEVLYSPVVARWVAERQTGEVTADGGYVVAHQVFERRWLMQEVMRYGGEAELGVGSGGRRLT